MSSDKTEEELLNESDGVASEQAAGDDEDEVEATLRASMEERGLLPGDTSALAKNISEAADDHS